MIPDILSTSDQPTSPIITTLSHLRQANSGVVAAYDSAVDRLKDNVVSHQFSKFAEDYRSYEKKVTDCIVNLGGVPITENDLNHLVLTGKVMVADLLGDKAIMQAMAGIQKLTEDAHRGAIDEASVLGLTEVESMLRDIVTEAQDHINWIEDTIKTRH